MDARGLVAFIVTVHEVAVLLAVLVGALIAVIGTVVLRQAPPMRRFLSVAAFSVGAALICFTVTARLFHVTAIDVEVVRIGE